MQLGRTLHLRAGAYRAHICPEGGARLTSLSWSGAGVPMDLLVPWRGAESFDAHDWPKAGAFAMLPYTNRILHGHLKWNRRTIQLERAAGAEHSLHGFGHRRSWTVVKTTADSATLAYRHPAGDPAWPWPFAAVLRIALDEDGAQVHLALTNTADEAAPAGLGWHPFHPLPAAHARLSMRARGTHDVGADGLNLFRAVDPAGRRHDLSLDDATLGPQTTAFDGWDGALALQLDPATQLAVSVRGCRHLVVHVPRPRSHICIEPVTLLPGALRHADKAAPDARASLAPGATRRIAWRCGVRLLSNPP